MGEDARILCLIYLELVLVVMRLAIDMVPVSDVAGL